MCWTVSAVSGLPPHIRCITGRIAARVLCINSSWNPAEMIQSRVRLHERWSAVRTSLSLIPHKQNYARCSLRSVRCTWGAGCGKRFGAVVKRGRMLHLLWRLAAVLPPEEKSSPLCGFDPMSNQFGSFPCRLTKQINEHSHIL